MATHTLKVRVATCSKPDCGWKQKVKGDKYAIEAAKKEHFDTRHSAE